jgi:hypothetical protein
MTEPELAIEHARQAVAAMRARGAYGEDLSRYVVEPSDPLTTEKLLEWALIEPDLRDVRSTRRLGKPVTLLKHTLLRLLGQYHAQLIAEQTRFNVNVVIQVRRLENRIEELERQLSPKPSEKR